MYDRLFSPQWMYDRCLEGSFLFSGWEGFGLLFLFFFGLTIASLFACVNKKLFYRVIGVGGLLGVAILCMIGAYIFLGFIIGEMLFSFIAESQPTALYAIATGCIVCCIVGLTFFSLVSGFYKRTHVLYRVFMGLIVGIVSLGAIAGVYVSGFFFFCNTYRQYYPALEAAHKLHGVMKTWHDAGVSWPQDLTALRATDEASFDALVANAKISYVSDLASNRFTLFVRPSKYSMVIFDSVHDYRYYPLNPWYTISAGEYAWPPEYAGPWEQMPK